MSERKKARAAEAARADLKSSPATARHAAQVVPLAIVVNGNDLPGRVLIDRFGHLHSRGVLTTWPERVKVAMGLRFCDPSEMEGAGNGPR